MNSEYKTPTLHPDPQLREQTTKLLTGKKKLKSIYNDL